MNFEILKIGHAISVGSHTNNINMIQHFIILPTTHLSQWDLVLKACVFFFLLFFFFFFHGFNNPVQVQSIIRPCNPNLMAVISSKELGWWMILIPCMIPPSVHSSVHRLTVKKMEGQISSISSIDGSPMVVHCQGIFINTSFDFI